MKSLTWCESELFERMFPLWENQFLFNRKLKIEDDLKWKCKEMRICFALHNYYYELNRKNRINQFHIENRKTKMLMVSGNLGQVNVMCPLVKGNENLSLPENKTWKKNLFMLNIVENSSSIFIDFHHKFGCCCCCPKVEHNFS